MLQWLAIMLIFYFMKPSNFFDYICLYLLTNYKMLYEKDLCLYLLIPWFWYNR